MTSLILRIRRTVRKFMRKRLRGAKLWKILIMRWVLGIEYEAILFWRRQSDAFWCLLHALFVDKPQVEDFQASKYIKQWIRTANQMQMHFVVHDQSLSVEGMNFMYRKRNYHFASKFNQTRRGNLAPFCNHLFLEKNLSRLIWA